MNGLKTSDDGSGKYCHGDRNDRTKNWMYRY